MNDTQRDALLDRIAKDLIFEREHVGALGCQFRMDAGKKLAALEKLRADVAELEKLVCGLRTGY